MLFEHLPLLGGSAGLQAFGQREGGSGMLKHGKGVIGQRASRLTYETDIKEATRHEATTGD